MKKVCAKNWIFLQIGEYESHSFLQLSPIHAIRKYRDILSFPSHCTMSLLQYKTFVSISKYRLFFRAFYMLIFIASSTGLGSGGAKCGGKKSTNLSQCGKWKPVKIPRVYNKNFFPPDEPNGVKIQVKYLQSITHLL